MAAWDYTNARLTDASKQIRLLHFISSSGEDNVQCSLEIFWLEEAPTYAAVSYTWGSPDDLRDILVNDTKFSVRPNCHAALMQISHQLGENEPYFWLDSICIDQANLNEKAIQVQMMGEIFASARQILACIGDHADNSELAISTVKQLAAFIRSKDGVCTNEMAIDKETEIARASGNVADFLTTFTKAYTDFGNREYWNRMWIVQEARLAKQMLLLCGSDSIALSDFVLLLEALLPPKEQGYVGFPQLWLQNSMYYVLAGSKHLLRNDNPSFLDTDHVCRALYEYRSWRCFDFRDRLYALLGFVKWPGGVEPVEPDYSGTKLDLIRLVIARLQGVSWSQHFCFTGTISLVEALDLSLDDPGVSQLIQQRRPASSNSDDCSLLNDLSLGSSLLIHFAGSYRLRPGARRLSRNSEGKLTAKLSYSPGRTPLRLPARYSDAGFEIVVNGEIVGYASFDARPGDFLLQLDEDYARPTWMILRLAEKNFEIVGNAFPLCNAFVEKDAASSYPLAAAKMSPSATRSDERPAAERSTPHSYTRWQNPTSRPPVTLLTLQHRSSSVVAQTASSSQANTMLRALALYSGLALLVRAQLSGSAFSNNLLCNGNFAQANATGLFSFNPQVDQGQQQDQPDNHSGKSKPLEIVYTVTQNPNDSRIQASTWISTNGANFSDDFQLGYDVCGLNFGPLFDNTIRRGQNDNGSCLQTFDEACVGAIKYAVSNFAVELTLNPTPPPNSNLTSSSLPTVCNDIGQMLTSALPTIKECKPFFNSSASVGDAIPLTGYNTSGLSSLNTCKANGSYYEVQTFYADYDDANWADYTQGISPILAVWFPIANAARPSTIQYAVTGMICAHITDFKEGSVRPPALPAATPVNENGGGGGGLSGGAIAGIVIGVLVAVALVIGALLWFFLGKRRKANKAAQQENTLADEKGAASASDDGVGSLAAARTVTNGQVGAAELAPSDTLARQELDGGKTSQLHELGSHDQQEAKELIATEKPAPTFELEGSAPSAVEKE